MKTLRQRHQALCVKAVFEPLQIFKILLERFHDMSRHAGIAPAGLHRVERGGESQGKFVKMALKFAVTAKAQSAHNSNDGRWVGAQALRHGAHAEQHIFAWMLENRADDFLPLDAQLLDAFAQMHRSRGGRTILAFHQARGLLKSLPVSTDSSRGFSSLNRSTIFWLRRP